MEELCILANERVMENTHLLPIWKECTSIVFQIRYELNLTFDPLDEIILNPIIR